MKKVIVTGANGFVGSFVCKELLEHGYQVKAMHRKGADPSRLENLDVQSVEADITKAETLDSAFQDVEIIFNIAALFRQAKFPDSVYWQTNVEGVRNVLDAAIRAGVKKVIHCSTVGVHSHIPNPPASEDEEHRPGDIYQETKSEGEKLALEYFRSGRINGVVIRPAMIWGPSDDRTFKLYKGIYKKSMPLISGNTHVHWILVSDLARSFRLAAEKEVNSGEVFIIAGEQAVPMRKLFKTIANAYKVSAPKIAWPALPFQLLGDLCELICKPFGIEPPIYRRRVDFFTKTRWFDNSKAQKLLGFQPQYDFEKEVQLIADWYKKNAWL